MLLTAGILRISDLTPLGSRSFWLLGLDWILCQEGVSLICQRTPNESLNYLYLLSSIIASEIPGGASLKSLQQNEMDTSEYRNNTAITVYISHRVQFH